MSHSAQQSNFLSQISHSRTMSRTHSPGKLVVAGLFAGIGGIEEGLRRAGHRGELLCEIDAPALAVLEERFPSVKRERDVTRLARLPRSIDLVAAGFPCQDLSQAGKTRGMAGRQSSLVSHVFRLLEQRKTPWVLLENVPFMLQLGKGRALRLVLDSLEELGYNWAYRVVDTRAFGIPQRRQRVYILASCAGDPRNVLLTDDASAPPPVEPSLAIANGFYWTEGTRGLGWADDAVPTLKSGSTVGIPSPPAILLPSGDIVKPDIRDAERLQGFPADWSSPAVDVGRASYRWRLVGNAVTVDVAHWIGKRLRRPRQYNAVHDRRLEPGRWPRAAWCVDGKRHVADVSAWPHRLASVALQDFLEFEPTPLSERATRGFFKRMSASSLRFPKGFPEAVRKYLDRVATDHRFDRDETRDQRQPTPA